MKKIFVSLFSICACLLMILQAATVFASSINPFAKAVSDGRNGAVVQWEIEQDSSILGFNVYRLEKRQPILLNNKIIAGSALTNAEKSKYFKENVYSFYDSEGNLGTQYLIEAIDLEGKTRKIEVQTEYVESIASVVEGQAAFDELLQNAEKNDAVISDYPAAPADKLFSSLNEDFVQNADTQKWVAAQPGAKIAVKADGLYRVTRAQLAATNFNVNAPVANWQLYVDGVEQAIIVEPNGNYIEFYGRGIDTQYTDTKFYYLVVGTTSGRRMSLNSRKLNASQVSASSFLNNLNFKQRTQYSSVILNGDEENFFGEVVVSDPATTVTVNIKGIDTSVPQTTFSIKMHGLTLPAHTVRVKLNNAEIGTITGNARESMQKQFTVPTSLLIDGANVFSFTTSAGGDVVLFDTFSISYKRRYVADANRLTFTTAYGRATRVQGFTSSNIRVFDISDPNGTSLVNARIEGNGVFVPANRPQMLYAIADEAVLPVNASAVSSNAPSTISTSAAGKDLVIITHGNFKALAETLAVYRRSQGLTVEVVTTDDVYDEAGFGAVTPGSIRSFLQAVAPKYALLIGDGTYDQRNYFSYLSNPLPFANYVPTRMFETRFGEAVSDDLMVDFNNDNIPDLPLGRFPVKDNAALQNIINKIQSFEATVGTALLQKGATFVSDNPDGWDFYASNQRIRSQLPANTPVNYIRRSDGDAAAVRQMIINSINNGRFIVAYSGHGQISAWWSSSAFGTIDVPNLTNTVYPLFLPMNCLNGAFADPFSESLAEVMVESPNGAIAGWSSSGLTFPDQQELMAKRFFKSLGDGEFARLGDAIKSAKNATNDPDVRRSWILIGDPTLKVR
jgi:hypothetical protein